ncbi:MAG: ABC transporter permease [Prevotellaceae bacterium]|jgi:ABC-type antimicrobial peptide transport system permease subunit|nr:ABC transporter permease [Prevotellaceae bacterium]
MIKHYFKVAFRNMWKYRNQTLVSVAGLAVGFVCFAMATLWIRYEMTYDSFHKNADRMYRVYRHNNHFGATGLGNIIIHEISGSMPYSLAGYLKSTFPEIVNATILYPNNIGFKYEEVNHKADIIGIDSSFFRMFDVMIVEGSMDFLIPGSKKVAITRKKALQIFGIESPVGKKIEMDGDYEICAVASDLPEHSNYPFDFLTANMDSERYGHTLVEVVSGVDMESFGKKLSEHEVLQRPDIKNMMLTPITSVHYKDPEIKKDIQFQHIIIFAIAGFLLILCTLFNWLTLFVSRFRIRQRELALRTVYGASGRSLFMMLSVEFFMSLIAALVLGLAFINILNSPFCAVSGVKLELSAIYLESVIYIVGIIVVALTVFFLTLAIFRRRTLNAGMRGSRKILRKASIVTQLTVSIVFAFCTLVILKQMYYLHNSTDLGFSFKNRGSVNVWIASEEIEILNDKVKQIPEIKETLAGYYPLLPVPPFHYFTSVTNREGAEVNCQYSMISEQYARFYEFELIEGEFYRDDDDGKYVLINESAEKTFEWYRSEGKTFNDFEVKGVIKNIYNFSPTIAVEPVFYRRRPDGMSKLPCIMFKYDEGNWKTCVEKIRKIVEKEFPNKYSEYYNAEEEYSKYLKSENALLAILTVVSIVCLTVCIFGFVSMISLTCEERRKEIAIRKVNGATVKDILDIFFKEHLTLLAVGALIAFPVGYIIMKRWLQQYVIQTEISAWIYVAILLALMLIIVLCVGGRVYKTSRENPVKALNR